MSKDQKECLIRSNCNKNTYPLDINMIIGKPQLSLLTKFVPDISWLWYKRPTHLNFRYMNDLVSGEMVLGLSLLKFENDHLCDTCDYGKQSKKVHPIIIEKLIS